MTLNQRKVIKNVTEQVRKGQKVSVSKAMRDAGYSDSYASKPNRITDSEDWDRLMEENLPDGLLAKVHKQGLEATKKEQRISGRGDDGKVEYNSVSVEDYPTRHKYLNTAYQLKKKFPKETMEIDITGLKELTNALKTVATTRRNDNTG